jgi:opacity protein-like surface antigen
MIQKSRILILLAATALMPLAPAHAADYDPPIFVEEAEEFVPVEVGSGWYLRGDVGYVLSTDMGGVDYRTFDPITATYGSASFDDHSLDEDFTWGGGFGYRYNDWIRGDLTVDGFRADFDGTTSSDGPCSTAPAFAGTGCRSEDSSSVSVLSLMANGYVDLGTYVRVTPYVGAGVGYSYLSWGGLDSTNYCVDGVGLCPAPGGAVSSADHDGEKDWRFTYAFMAGAAYDLTKNLKLDVGYKYRHIDGGDMFGWDDFSETAGASGIQGTDDGFSTHEVKVGLRYELW